MIVHRKARIKTLFFYLLVLVLPLSVHSQPVREAVYTDSPPFIDGLLEPGEWENALRLDTFYQREPDVGEPISEKTEVYIMYDKSHIYFGIRCYDDPEKITAKELARDVSLGEDDRIQIILDTYRNQRTAYWFQIGPRGSIGDALISENGASFNKAWDGLWNGKAKITAIGWEAEIVIPFKTLSFKKGQSSWGFKFIRHIRRKLESAYWPVANLNSYKFQVSDAGILTGLEGISKGIGLDVNPYALGGIIHREEQSLNYEWDAGLDIFYRPTPALKTALSVNTDFAQTEVDNRQINLTRFNLHFPEKRDFFLDGANYFQFGLEGDGSYAYSKRLIPFFSRRLGLDQNGNPIPIIYGAKVTGQVGNNTNVGIINLMDHRDSLNSMFTAARITQNIGRESTIGFIGTQGNANAPGSNVLTGADVKLASSRFNGNKNIALILFGLKSFTEGIQGNDMAWGAEMIYPNDFFNLRAGHVRIGEDFKAGIGFVPRTGIRETFLESALGPRPDKWGLMQVRTGAGLDYITDFNNILLTRIINLNIMELRFESGETLSFQSTSQYEKLTSDFQIFKNFVIPQDNYDFWWHKFQILSAKRRNFYAGSGYRFGNFYSGARKDLSLEMGYKIVVPLFIGGEIQHNHIELPEGGFVAKIYRANVHVLFSPNITLYSFLQYDNNSETMGWQSRFHWIIEPGKEIMLVWNSIITDPIERFAVVDGALRFKAKYNIRF